MSKFTVICLTLATLSLAMPAYGELIVYDSFESVDLSSPGARGFQWNSKAPTSIATSTNKVLGALLTGESAPAKRGSQRRAKTGQHSLKFLYPAGEPWIEQRFKLSEPKPEIWMGFWLRVPTNYSHPRSRNASDNQKLFTLWMDGYSNKGEGSTVGMEFRRRGDGNSYFYGKVSRGNYSVTGSDQGAAQFIDVPRDRGRWMHLVVHVNSESAPGEKDGVMEVWRKWEGDAAYVKTHDLRKQPITLSGTTKGFANGYLMGWHNAAYPVATEYLIDDFELSTEPVFINSHSPNPPSGIIIE